jgi:hypothetical protein
MNLFTPTGNERAGIILWNSVMAHWRDEEVTLPHLSGCIL